jgi:uncharacterized membrane protein
MAWAYIAAALVLGFLVPRIHAGPGVWVNRALGKDQLIAFLSSVASGMMAFTGIVFSLLFLLLQFGSTAYSPHLFPMLTRNRALTHAGGVFTGTFMYSLMALRAVGADEGATSDLTVWTAFVWLLGSVYMLLRLIGVFAALGVTDVLEMLGALGIREVDRLYKEEAHAKAPSTTSAAAPATGDTQQVVHRGKMEYLVGIDVPRLVALAREAGAVIRIPVGLGDSVAANTVVATVESVDGSGVIPHHKVLDAITLDRDRSVERCPKQALRLLVDIAIRALSAAMNDPTTAVHSIDQIETILVRLGSRDLDIGRVPDSSGVLRLDYDLPTWEEYLDLGVTEIQQYGANSVQVERRLAALFTMLHGTVRPAHRAAVERLSRERLTEVHRAFPDGLSRSRSEAPDRQGIGNTVVAAHIQ